MNPIRRIGLKLLLSILFLPGGFMTAWCSAHTEPTSFVDLKLTSRGLAASFVASTTDFAHYLPDVEPAMLLHEEVSKAHREALASLIASQFKITADGLPVHYQFKDLIAIPGNNDIRVNFLSEWKVAPRVMRLESHMFPYDPRHRTHVNVYLGEHLIRQEAFDAASIAHDFEVSANQPLMQVVHEFVYEGIHHIFIGPDHILFVVGLLLLGGNLRRLMTIISAFTVAHSITLCLATFRILSPPASIIEPVIALSIVVVGAHALIGTPSRDPRLLFAFLFGFIHGFGFANVLQEMVLPREALGWSLFAFNAGVEIGQACIVLTVAPILAYLRQQSPRYAERVVSVGALSVTAAGAFWFFERVMG